MTAVRLGAHLEGGGSWFVETVLREPTSERDRIAFPLRTKMALTPPLVQPTRKEPPFDVVIMEGRFFFILLLPNGLRKQLARPRVMWDNCEVVLSQSA